MNTRRMSVAGTCAVAFLLTPFVFADRLPESRSPQTRVANELDSHEAAVRALDRQFLESITDLEKSYLKQRTDLRKRITKKLNAQKKALTQEGDLENAVSVRDKIAEISASDFIVPGPHGSATTSATILGTWRWNNGVDIKNLGGGKTNGKGTWRLIDAKEKTYEFNWSRIPADRVRLSENGRVLEGTKANDPTFRVWAVRID